MRLISALVFCVIAFAQQPFYDRTHASKVFGQDRNYRIFLPPSYEDSAKRYPVIYYFHGHSDRYTLEHYDKGKDTVPKIAAFVASNDAIVVSVDGFVPADYSGFYGGTPWDVYEKGGKMDFGPYFLELIEYIDATYRTLTDRRHRATSGLSMGGFMSLYLSARYPQLVGSASSFNPGPEFFTGETGRRMLWRPKDHVNSHSATMIRLIRASGDYISQYHEETRAAYAASSDVDFDYRQDEYLRHWATSIGETFEFHMRAFATSALNNVPVRWSYASAYRSFNPWGWQFETQGDEAGFTYLTDVTQRGLRITTRKWAPDGPAVASRQIQVTTAPLYEPGAKYRLTDYNLSSNKTSATEIVADASGRLRFSMDGAGHQISFEGPGATSTAPVMLPVTTGDVLRLSSGDARLPVRIYNPRPEPMRDVRVVVSTRYPTVELTKHTIALSEIPPRTAIDLSDRLAANLTGGGDYFERARVRVTMTFDGYQNAAEEIDLLIQPDPVPQPEAFEVLDGRTATFRVFRQKGNQGGGASVERTVTEGKGNGNGVLEPGEEATIWVKLRQGLDPFDKNNWYRAKVYSRSPRVTEVRDIQEQKQLEWTGAKERTSLVRLAADTRPGEAIELLLDNESWSYRFTPDVRYGAEPLYQAFQLHKRHLHRIMVTTVAPQPPASAGASPKD